MKFSLLLLFHALVAGGGASLLTLFLIQTMVRKLFVTSETIVVEVRAEEPSFVSSQTANGTETKKSYSPHAYALNQIQGLIPALYFLFPPIGRHRVQKSGGVYQLSRPRRRPLFLASESRSPKRPVCFRPQNPYPISKDDDETD